MVRMCCDILVAIFRLLTVVSRCDVSGAMLKKLSVSICVGFYLVTGLAFGAEANQATKEKVEAAVQAWCDGLLSISAAQMDGGNPREVAVAVIDEAYNYGDGQTTLFKPTLTFGDQTFRTTKEGALAYFVGGDEDFPDDSGFALNPWVKAKFDVAGIKTDDNIGIYMGNVFLTDKDGAETMVDKMFVFRFYPDGSFKILAHKSALPVTPAKE